MHGFDDMDKEQGFTLIELLVVILIIGILAAIAIPIFMNQRKEAAAAAVKSDLKNAASVMETEMIANKKYPTYMPVYNPRSEGVDVSLDKTKSSAQQFCLKGKSDNHAEIVFYYDSVAGGLLRDGQTCSPVPAGQQSYSAQLSGQRMLVLQAGQNGSYQGVVMPHLRSYGFGEVVYDPTATVEDFKNYDVVAALGTAWRLDAGLEAKLKAAYDSGAKILTDGNDTDITDRNWMIASSLWRNADAGSPLYFYKTNNPGLTPAFPYTFDSTSFSGDSGWQCIRQVQPGIVEIATSPLSNDASITCVTSMAATNGAGGRWVHMSRGNYTAGMDRSMSSSALDWLLM